MFLLFVWEGQRGTEELPNCMRKSVNVAISAKYHSMLYYLGNNKSGLSEESKF